AQPGSRQLDDRRPQPGADPSLPTAVSIPPRRSLLRWYGPAANTSASSASANFNITSRTLPRNASLNRSGPKRPSIWLKHCILFQIGVFLLGLTLPMSQILFWDTERIRLLYFPQQAGRRPRCRPKFQIAARFSRSTLIISPFQYRSASSSDRRM